MKLTSPALALLLAACSGQSPSSPPVDDSPDLEQAAIESGAIADVSRMDPAGLFMRRHEAGTDMLCMTPDGDREYRFGAVATSGDKSRCFGRGRAKRAGQLLVLRFDKPSRCIIVAQYEGDRVALAGAVDVECDKLCSERSSFAGVSVPRISSNIRTARSVRGVDGAPMCRAAS
ncbi:hypothetical protein [Rhizorhapis suberifaciens]|uniref:Lipoprotein n=1 Tax=Rhizorhapis suberifaciens TaxID=13656 RepID=A0A840HPV3_9SPHN|nr:hypothetical protein [Rhizorhapis suberifaciens]MBB4639893.1 hypothetical protein [Rhizorhapis suberifaciens]